METATRSTAKRAASSPPGSAPTCPPALQIGSYTGGGVGLSTGGDAVNLFDAGGVAGRERHASALTERPVPDVRQLGRR